MATSETDDNQGPLTHQFAWQGRNYSLFKKPGSTRNSPWYFRTALGQSGERKVQSLKTNIAANAEAAAKMMLSGAQKGKLDEVRALLSGGRTEHKVYSTIAEIVRVWERAALDVGETHRQCCVYSLRSVLRAVYPNKTLEDLSASVLTDALVNEYFADAKRRCRAAGVSQEKANRIRRSTNSTCNQMLCLFQADALHHYRAARLTLPDVSVMKEAYKAQKFTAGATPRYDAPPEGLLRKTLHEWLKLPRNEFIAVGLELACGLRAGEVSQVTWSMFTRDRSGALLEGTVRVKNGAGRLLVVPIDPFWKVLNRRIDREGWRGQENDFVITGPDSFRNDSVFRIIGAWMRGLGWESQKTNHAMRAYSGSLIAMKHGIYRASAWLRHSSVKVTEQHYTHFVNSRVFRPEQVLVRWAKANNKSTH